ncbi:MAG: endonuclease/exonuclease/phosphatase family protein [bacterium]
MRRIVLLLVLWSLAACGGGGDDPGTSPTPGLTVAQLNMLHGTTGMCPQMENCRLDERADLLAQWIKRSGCPDVVTLQEGWSGWLTALQERATTICPFAYQVLIASPQPGIDEAIVLTRYPVLHVEQAPLFPGFRKVMHVRIDHPLGGLDVYTTHLASGSDGAQVPCSLAGAPCPSDCVAAGAQDRRDCQAVQMAAFIEATHDVDTPAVVSGDFNSDPDSFVYRQFTERGWHDVYLAAGNPECDPATGIGCTSGREDASLVELESPQRNESARIDFIFLIPPRNAFPCDVQLDSPADADGDGTATRLFTDAPNPFARECGAAPLPICWPSDHEGVQMDLNCR